MLSTPRTCSSRSTENPPTATAAADPVVSLSGQLLTIWDALDASEAESLKLEREKDINLKAKRDRTIRLLEEWRVSVETQIGFTQATSAAGALVQLARALDELDTLVGQLDHEKQAEIEPFEYGSSARR